MMPNENEAIVSPTIPTRKKWNRTNWCILLGALFLIIALVNSYFLFISDSKVSRSYYIPDYALVKPSDYKEVLPLQGFVAAKETRQVFADASELEAIQVKKGQQVLAGDVLAEYNIAEQEMLIRSLQSELEAYENEVSGLKTALSEVQFEVKSTSPTSHINTSQNADLVSVNVEMELVQQPSSIEATALLKSYIAEAERQIDITNSALSEAKGIKQIVSPLDATISDILTSDQTVTFVLESNEKNIVAYVEQDEWEKIMVDQTVVITVDEAEDPFVGTVSEKQSIPATQSIYVERAMKENMIRANETVYEIRIDALDLLPENPYTSIVGSEITVNEYMTNYIVPSAWIKKKEVNKVEELQMYSIGYDGRLRLSPVFVNGEADIEFMKAIEKVSEDGSTAKNKVADQQINDIKDKDHEAISFFTGSFDEKTLLIQNKKGQVYSYAFLPLPLETFSFKKTGKVEWKDVLKYLIF